MTSHHELTPDHELSHPTASTAGGDSGRHRWLRASALRAGAAVLLAATATVVVASDATTADAAASFDTAALTVDLSVRDTSRVSRSGGRRSVGADGAGTVEAEALEKLLRAKAARAAARAAERAAEQRRLQELEARRWRAPLSGYGITATYGASSSLWSSSHTGVDLDAAEGAPVTSVARGRVASAGYDGSYGNKVVVRHDDGTQTWYAHLSAVHVRAGQLVTNRTLIGAVGATGNVTGSHLHLELRLPDGQPVDPVAALRQRGLRL